MFTLQMTAIPLFRHLFVDSIPLYPIINRTSGFPAKKNETSVNK
jgi:hypothetical protein